MSELFWRKFSSLGTGISKCPLLHPGASPRLPFPSSPASPSSFSASGPASAQPLPSQPAADTGAVRLHSRRSLELSGAQEPAPSARSRSIPSVGCVPHGHPARNAPCQQVLTPARLNHLPSASSHSAGFLGLAPRGGFRSCSPGGGWGPAAGPVLSRRSLGPLPALDLGPICDCLYQNNKWGQG